jgi:amyloid beta precursor protein binding protein 1
VRHACKQARFLRALRVHSAAGEAALDDATCAALRAAFAEAAEAAEAPPEDAEHAREHAPVVWYAALRAADAFAQAHGRVPGAAAGDDLAADAEEVLRLGHALLARAGVDEAGRAALSIKHAAEVVRYGGCELQMTAAIIGGIAAQEAVKILTHQYVPLDNTYVYSGITGISAVMQL